MGFKVGDRVFIKRGCWTGCYGKISYLGRDTELVQVDVENWIVGGKCVCVSLHADQPDLLDSIEAAPLVRYFVPTGSYASRFAYIVVNEDDIGSVIEFDGTVRNNDSGAVYSVDYHVSTGCWTQVTEEKAKSRVCNIRYYIPTGFLANSFAYVERLNGKATSYTVSGNLNLQTEWGVNQDKIVSRGDWKEVSESEAKARVRQDRYYIPVGMTANDLRYLVRTNGFYRLCENDSVLYERRYNWGPAEDECVERGDWKEVTEAEAKARCVVRVPVRLWVNESSLKAGSLNVRCSPERPDVDRYGPGFVEVHSDKKGGFYVEVPDGGR
jgi:hypothetical protein